MPSLINPTPYPFSLAATGANSHATKPCYGTFFYVQEASGPFQVRLNGGTAFKAKLGTKIRLTSDILTEFSVASLGAAVTCTIVIAGDDYEETAILLDGEVNVAATGWSVFGNSNNDKTVTNVVEVEIWGGDPDCDMVFVKHIGGTAPARLASTDVGINTNRGVHLDPGEATYLPIPKGGSVWACTSGASITLACAPFFR